MRYEVRPEETKDGRKVIKQWVIWDNLEQKVFARFNNPEQPTDIVNKYHAAQMAAEASSE